MTFDIEKCDLRYRTRTISIHDIECKLFRYRCDFDIDSEDFDIEYYVRYRASDTRYRGAKVPDKLFRVSDSATQAGCSESATVTEAGCPESATEAGCSESATQAGCSESAIQAGCFESATQVGSSESATQAGSTA